MVHEGGGAEGEGEGEGEEVTNIGREEEKWGRGGNCVVVEEGEMVKGGEQRGRSWLL